jgi:predicted phage terminase large subunit-like protein
VVAAIDFAFSLGKKSDYTAIVVVGMNTEGDIFVLDIDRFKTDKIKDFQDAIVHMHEKWGFRKIRAEVNAAQGMIVKDLLQKFKEDGNYIKIDQHAPSRHEGTKEERIQANLEVKYDNQVIWHYRGGYIPMLEEELVMARPPHDDIKDALSSAVEILIKPRRSSSVKENVVQFQPNRRFGGMGTFGIGR